MNSISAGDGISARAAGVMIRRGVSGGREPSKGGAGVAELMAYWIGTVVTGSMEDCEGEALRGGRGFRAVGAGRGAVGGVDPIDRNHFPRWPEVTSSGGSATVGPRRNELQRKNRRQGRLRR